MKHHVLRMLLVMLAIGGSIAAFDGPAAAETMLPHVDGKHLYMARGDAGALERVLNGAHAAVPAEELLQPEKAFRISTRALDERIVEVRFDIADGYYMYRDRFKFETQSGKVLPGADIPRGVRKKDEFFGETETHRREIVIRVPLQADDIEAGRVKLKVTSQGCSDQGVCYVPLEQLVELKVPSVWCSKDRAKAWNDLMLKDIEPTAPTDCDNPIEALVALGRKLGAPSTPTWFLPNGEKYQGALPMSTVVPMLDATAPPRKR